MSHGLPRWMVTAAAGDEAAFRAAIGAGTGGTEIPDGAVTETKLASAVVTTINAKAPATHTHAPSDITGTAVITSDARLSDARTPTAHAHAIADTTGLQAALDGKSATGHSHAQADVTGLVAALAGKAEAAHAHSAGDLTSGTVPAVRLGTGTANATTFLRGDQTWAAPSGGASPVAYVAPGADTAINNVADVTVVTRDVTNVGATDILDVTADFIILNNSGATRVYVITLDFDGLFDVEFTTGALAFSATLMHPFTVRGVLGIRSTSLAYATFVAEGQLAAGIASGGDTTMAATHLRASGWGETASNASGTCTVTLRIRSANATATQTCRLLSFVVNKYTPT